MLCFCRPFNEGTSSEAEFAIPSDAPVHAIDGPRGVVSVHSTSPGIFSIQIHLSLSEGHLSAPTDYNFGYRLSGFT